MMDPQHDREGTEVRQAWRNLLRTIDSLAPRPWVTVSRGLVVGLGAISLAGLLAVLWLQAWQVPVAFVAMIVGALLLAGATFFTVGALRKGAGV